MLILAALACGQSTPVPPTAVPPTKAPPTAPPTVPSGTSPKVVELTLVNDSGLPVCYVYISSVQSDEWGENWLAQDEVVRSGGSRVFQVEGGDYDLRAEDCDGNLVDVQNGAQITAGVTWTLLALQRAPVLIVNQSSYEICYLYISPTDSQDWGPDWLGHNTIPSGSTHTLQVPLGTYDLRAEDCDHNPLNIQNGISVKVDGITWTLNDVTEASLTLENKLDIPICQVFISSSGNTDWGADWLGENEVIPPGGSYTFSLPEGVYDLSARDCDGNPVSEEVYGQEIRGEMTWTIAP